MSLSRTLKTLPKRCKNCRDDVRYCDCPKTWYVENVVPDEQRLHIRFPENATVGTRFDACYVPIEVFLLLSQFMNPITLLMMMQALYPWVMPSTIISHLRHNAKRTYSMMHDFLICLETGFVSDSGYWTHSYGPLPACFAFSCKPAEYNHENRKHTCQCGFTYDVSGVQSHVNGPFSPTINFKYTQNASEVYLKAFTDTFEIWTGTRMGPYDQDYADYDYYEYEYEAELEAKTDTAHLTKERVKSENKSHEREKKLTRAHKNARNSRIKHHYTKGRNTPKRNRDLKLV